MTVAVPEPEPSAVPLVGALPVDVPLAEVTRGPHVESRHRGAVAVVRGAGEELQVGPADEPVWMRSAIKPFQALPLVERGIADRLALTSEELAVIQASHDGTPLHTETVAGILARAGLDPEQLGCGPHAPFDKPASLAIARAGDKPRRIHNNCSGKHSGFLLLAQDLGQPLDTYLDPEGPTQQLVRAAVADLAGLDPAGIPCAVDGCGAPTLRIPLTALARAFFRWMNPDGLPPVRRAACERLFGAANSAPIHVAGEHRLCTALIRSAPGRVHGKNGAEGVYAVGAVGREGPFAVAVKVADGAERGYVPVIVELLRHFGLWETVPDELLRFVTAPVRNTNKEIVGEARSVFEVPAGW